MSEKIRPRWNPFYSAALTLTALIIIFNAIYWVVDITGQISRWSEDKLEDYTPFINAFVSIVQTYREDGHLIKGAVNNLTQHLRTNCADGDLRFAQIVIDRDQIANCMSKDSGELTFTIDDLQKRIQTRWVQLPNGILCWVIQQTIASGPALRKESYVEMGVSAAELQISITNKILLAFFFTLLLPIVAVVLVTIYLNRRFSPSQAQGQPKHSPQNTDQFAEVAEVPATPFIEAEAPTVPAVDLSGSHRTAKKTVLTKGGPLTLHLEERLVETRDQTVQLTPKEHQLLSLLTSEAGRIFSEREIITRVWPEGNPDSPPTSKDVKQQIFFLRKKLQDDAESPIFIGTERGLGYRLLTENSTKI
ncbi:winged helix-turn-helix transcriptional regulator [Candidatus Acetothermia bacterium]|nr:winged helix-turn-helix transcriptional regulator [Candidatus Acetothermia bacterium]